MSWAREYTLGVRVSTSLAVLLGAPTIWPLVYFVVFAGIVLSQSFRAETPAVWLIVGHLGTILVMMGLLTFYLLHALKTPTFTDGRVLVVTHLGR